MEKAIIGATDKTILIFIPDPAATDGAGKTGLTHADLKAAYVRVETDNDVTVSDVTSSLSTLSALTDAHTDWGVKEVSSSLAPGLYRLDIADAVFASGAVKAVVYVSIDDDSAPVPKEFQLVTYDTDELGSSITSGFSGVNTKLDTIDDYVDTEVAAIVTLATAIKAVTDKLDETLEDDSGVYRFTAHALMLAPGGVGSSAAWQVGTGLDGFEFVMRQAANAGLGAANLSVTAQRFNGVGFEACTNSPVEIGNGAYAIDFSIADSEASGGRCAIFRFSAAGALDTFVTLILSPAA